MTSIRIYNPQGYSYEAKWNGSVLFPITDSCERIANVMGEDCVRLVFKLPNKVVFDAFAYIVYNGQTFFLKEQYIPTPDGTFKEDNGDISTAYFSYDVKFVSVGNMLDKFICYRHVKVTNAGEWDEPEININGNLETLYVIIMGSIQQASNRLKAQYGQLYFADLLDTIVANGLDGNMPNTENVKLTANTNLLTFNFSGDNIANVCTTVANSFTNDDKKDTEWYIIENNGSLTLHFAKCVDKEYGVQYVSDYISDNVGADSSVRPQKSGGLKKVEYSQAWSGITNVIVPYGSTRNMSYQAAKGIDEITQMQSTFGKRLRLIPNTSYNVKDKEGNEVIITTDSHGAIRNNYVDTGIEQVKFYDEIYPQGHFRVTSVETKNKRQDGEIVPEYTVSGIAIDSKGNEIQPAEGFYPIVIEEGTTLSVRFEKGLLNGREFEIANKTRKDEGATTYSLKFTIVADGSIEDGTLIPSGNFIPREGDEFALFNMKMPEVYITAAQQELAQRAYDELVELQTSRPQVKCTTDPTTWDKPIALGYQFKVMSELFNSEDSFISRVTSYSYKLTKPYDVQFTLASAIMQGTLSQMNDLISDVTHQAGGLEQRAINLSRRGWRDAAEMAEMVDSLAADMMLVGNEKYQFAFTAGIEIVNSNNQTTAIKIGEGTLQHTQDPYISDYTCQGWWSHGAVTLNNGHTENGSAALPSVPDTPFYLYAVVGQNSTDISFELQDQEQDGEAYLLLGILSSAFADNGTNYRVFNRTNGYTQISGGTITTEQIQDAGRNLIIDFQSNPPRIIARNGAEIIGNIKFKASDEMTAEEQLAALGIGVSQAQSTADAAEQAAKDEAEKVREEYKAAIAESEDNMTEALAASVAEINGGIGELQKQIDGEVSSYFYDTAPVGTDETILTNKEPFSEWAKNYTLSNGVYVLKENARNEFVNHIGDTYTNMEEYKEDSNGNTTTPLAGLAWRWCDATAVSPLPAKYITVSYKGSDGNNITKKLHWHKIADSDAVKALQEAAKAQSTADGKSTTFVVEPTNYSIGDLWILAADRTLNGKAYKQGTILTANAASATFVASHWSEKVKYIDESIAAQQAQQALDGLEIGGMNLLRYTDQSNYLSKFSGWVGTLSLSNGWIKVTQNSGGSSVGAITSKDSKNDLLIKGKEYVLSFDAYLDNSASISTLGLNSNYLMFNSGSNYIIIGVATITKTPARYSIKFTYTGENTATFGAMVGANIANCPVYYVKNIKLEQGNKATDWTPAPEDVDSKADAIKVIADGAAASAKQSNDQLANMSNDSILTPQEKGSVADEWACIQEEYSQNSNNKTTAWGSATVAEWTTYNTAYTTLQTYVGTLALTDRTNNTTIVKSTFQANFANYYSANVAFLNALSKKVAELEVAAMEIGVRNLWAKKYMMDWNNTYAGIATKGSDGYGEYIAVHETYLYEYIGDRNAYEDILQGNVEFEESKQYCLKVKWRTPVVQSYSGLILFFKYSDGTNGYDTNSSIRCPMSTTQTVNTLISEKGKTVTGICCTYGALNNARIYEIQLVQATKQPNDWLVAPEDVDNAIAESTGYVDTYTGGNKSHNYLNGDSAQILILCNISSNAAYITSVNEDNGSGGSMIDPFGGSCLIAWNKGVGAPVNYYEIFDFGINNVYGVYRWGDTINCPKDAQLLVCLAQYDYISHSVKNNEIQSIEYPQNGTWILNDIKVYTNNALIAQAAMYKAEGLDYLKTALEDGSTEIAGGLTMTNVLMLKNLEGFVTAGLSGLTTHNNKEDKVLMWGGATYEEAYAAANNDEYNTGNGTITTLIKKDGTGKIGIFKISETQAVVDVPNQGKVIIDASTTNGGIRVLNSSGRINAALLPSSIGNFKPKANESSSTSGSKVYSSISTPSSNNVTTSTRTNLYLNGGTAISFPSGSTTTENKENHTKTTTVTVSCSSVSVERVYVSGSIRRMLGPSHTGEMKITITARLYIGGNLIKSGSTTTLLSETSDITWTLSNQIILLDTSHSLPTMGSSKTAYINITVSGTSTSSSPAGSISSVALKVWGGATTVSYKTTTAISYSYPPQTIIGTDGLISLVSNSKYFMVDNSGSTQRIYAKGLSNGADREAGSGELYVSDSFITAFKDFLEHMNTWVESVRAIGSNSTTATNMQNKIQDVYDKLTDTSLIANS